MSDTNKPSPKSSLAALSKPTLSRPPSPSLLALEASKQASSIPPTPSATADEMKILHQRLAQQDSAMQQMNDSIRTIASAIQMMHSNSQVKPVVDFTPASSVPVHDANADAIAIQTAAAKANANTHAQSRLTNTIVNRELNKDKIVEASKQLFGTTDSKLQAIEAYANLNNSSYNMMNDSTLDLNLTDTILQNNSNVSTQHINNIPFLTQLLPAPTSASQATVTELIQSGIKATASANNSKIKDVNQLLELLTEQAKLITTSTSASSDNKAAADYLQYTLHLFKLLFEFGLQATLEFHFKLLKKVQAGECGLNTEQPMLMLDIMSKYKRLHHTELLKSQPFYASSSNNKQPYSKPNARNATSKFTGTPCPYHTKLLGRDANHSAEQCRAKDKK